MEYEFIDPDYVEPGQEEEAEEFDEILQETLPNWAAEMSEGYAWAAPLPERDKFEEEAAKLAIHLLTEFMNE